jgi:hypothetical protein
VTTAVMRRLAEVEAAVDKLVPPKLKPELQWLRWATCDELAMLDREIYWPAEKEHRDLTEAEEARVMAIAYAAEARRLAGELPEDQKPPYWERR